MRGVVWNPLKQIPSYDYKNPLSIEHVWAEALEKSLIAREGTCFENFKALFITPVSMNEKDHKKILNRIKNLVDKLHPVYLIGKHDVDVDWYNKLPTIDPETLNKEPYYSNLMEF
jgi:hypothetical protein